MAPKRKPAAAPVQKDYNAKTKIFTKRWKVKYCARWKHRKVQWILKTIKKEKDHMVEEWTWRYLK